MYNRLNTLWIYQHPQLLTKTIQQMLNTIQNHWASTYSGDRKFYESSVKIDLMTYQISLKLFLMVNAEFTSTYKKQYSQNAVLSHPGNWEK